MHILIYLAKHASFKYLRHIRQDTKWSIVTFTWNPPPRKMGGQFYQALGDLEFSPSPGGGGGEGGGGA